MRTHAHTRAPRRSRLMGYQLRRWLADRLPAEVSSGERLVALEIADQANDQTRRAYGKDLLATVVRRTGFANEKQVGKVLGKLSLRGLELRVQLLKEGRLFFDGKGRPVFAYEGRETTYKIPTVQECPMLLVPQAGDQSGPPSGDEWSPAWSPVVPRTGPAGPPSGGPFSSYSPQDSSSLSDDEPASNGTRDEREMSEEDQPNPDTQTLKVMTGRGATIAEAIRILADVRREGRIYSPLAWAKSPTGDFPDRLKELRRASTPTAAPAGCGQCVGGWLGDTDRPTPCPTCKPHAVRQAG